jgi:hypothetical protein
MATILPDKPIGAIPAATLRVFRLLKTLPDAYTIWQRLTPGGDAGPDFWVRDATGRSALLCVAPATTTEVRASLQRGLFAGAETPGAAEQTALEQFFTRLSHHALDPVTLPGIVLFPQVARADLVLALPPFAAGIAWGSKDDLAPEQFADWLAAQLGPPLGHEQQHTLRHLFTPEVVVPAPLTVRAVRERPTAAGLTGSLLSYDQEWIVKHDLDLSDEGEAASGDTRLQLVNGVAGSGKSLVLLYRARLLRQFFPRKRVLVLTHNKPLILDLRRRYVQLSGGDAGVEWRTFHGWCHANWPDDNPPQLVGRRERWTIITRAWQQHLRDTALSPEALQDEIDWVKDRLITTRQGYLAADRSGRGFRLAEAIRERVYAAMLAYQDELRARERLDFGDVPRRIWRTLVEGGAAFPRYDIVLLDEAQFFAPIWFEIIKQVLAPNHGQLFMVADPTQGFLKRRQSWLASGLHVRGRSHRLQRCYRTTGAILAFATRFYQQRLPDDEDALVADMQQMAGGEPPEVVTLPSEQDELARVVNEVRALVEAGVPLAHILVIHADWQGAARALERLRATFGTARVVHPREAATAEDLRVCGLDAATGLESPIVFLMGAHRLCEAEGSLRFSADERAERVRDNTRRLYMAMTRAGQRLVLTYVGEMPEALRQAASGAAMYAP